MPYVIKNPDTGEYFSMATLMATTNDRDHAQKFTEHDQATNWLQGHYLWFQTLEQNGFKIYKLKNQPD